MKQYPEMNEGDIESLAMSRTFGELTDRERELVLAHLGGEEAYERMRRTIEAARASLAADGAALEPAPDIRASAREALRRRKAGTSSLAGMIGRIAGYRVPLYGPALAGMAAVAIFLMGRGDQPVPQVRERIVYREVAAPQQGAPARVDTEEIVRRVVDSMKDELQRPAPVRIRTVVVKERADDDTPRTPRSARAPQPERSSEPPQNVPMRGNAFVGLANLQQLDVQRRGKNLAEDSAGSRFMVSAVQEKF